MPSDDSRQTTLIDEAAPIRSKLASHPRLHKLAIKFVEQWPEKLAEMRSAHDGADLAALARLAHGVKGLGGSVGFDALFEPAKAVEAAAKAGDAAQAGRCLDQLTTLGRRLQAPAPMTTSAAPDATIGADR